MSEMLEDRENKRENILAKDLVDENVSARNNFGFSQKTTNLNATKKGEAEEERGIEGASREEKVETVFELLKMMQPYFSANNLTVIP